MRISAVVFLLCALVSVSACSHDLQITNLDEYYSPPASPLRYQRAVGVVQAQVGDSSSGRYVDAIVSSLQRSGNFSRVIYPYSSASHQDLVDTVVGIDVRTKYSGRGSNFFVNFPGFLIFAPAIWGYGYSADIATDVSVTTLEDGGSSQRLIPAHFDFRQAEIDRTWTEIGWLEFGIIPLIGGIVFMEYDPDVTSEFITRVSPYYGPYIATSIIALIPDRPSKTAPGPKTDLQPAAPTPPAPQ